MATAPDTTKHLEALLECAFCMERLTEPRTLSCFHSFCKRCLENYVAKQREDAARLGAEVPEIFECPVCRTEFHAKQGEGVEKVPSNYFINNMLDLLTLQQQSQRIKCQQCKADHGPATSRCISCEKHLCEKCLAAHNNWSDFDDHVVLTLEELAKPENRLRARPKPRCEKHKKQMKFYCETCKVLVCRYCIDTNHIRPEHTWFPLLEVVAKHKEALKTSSAIFEQQMNVAVQSNQEIEHAMKTLNDNATKTKDAIKHQQQEILSAFTKKLDKETAGLLDEVDKEYKKANEPLVKQIADMKAYLEKAKSSLEFAKNIISNGSDEEILSVKREVEEKAGMIEEERPEMMDPRHDGSIRYEAKPSKDVLETVKLNDLGKVVSAALRPTKKVQEKASAALRLKKEQQEQAALRLKKEQQEQALAALMLKKEQQEQVKSLWERSTILNGNKYLAQQLIEWVKDNKFSWQVCYRASQHGWRSHDFHRKCDDVGATVTLVKCGNNIFGGYTDQSWNQGLLGHGDVYSLGVWKRSNESYLFSLKNKDNLPPFQCKIREDEIDEAIYCDPAYGAGFGGVGVGLDLVISNNGNTNTGSYSDLGYAYLPPPGYQPGTPQTQSLLAGSFKFQPTEIEVFRR